MTCDSVGRAVHQPILFMLYHDDEWMSCLGPTCCFCKNISKIIMRDFAIVSGSWPVKVVSP